MKEIKIHVDELQDAAINTITNPIKDVIKVTTGTVGLAFALVKGFGSKIINTIENNSNE
tara:strand:- start:190 stop:366 length:177 start_codon:yes stop_codon:yes gene_type:complete